VHPTSEATNSVSTFCGFKSACSRMMSELDLYRESNRKEVADGSVGQFRS